MKRQTLRHLLMLYIVFCALYFVLIQPSFARTAIGLGSTYRASTSEIAAQIDVIAHLLNLAANTRYLGRLGTEYATHNLHGVNTNRTNIFWAAGGCGDPCAIVFYVGEGNCELVWNGMLEVQWFVSDNSGIQVYDKEIFPHSVCKNVFFTFLWSCEQGDVIGGTHLSGTPFGMPYAWRHSNQMSEDGYVNPIGDGLFIGFQGIAPTLTRTMAGMSQAGRNFTKYFYSKAFTEDWTANMALNRASMDLFGVGFADCIFRTGYIIDGLEGGMVVYGCGILKLYEYGVSGGGGGGDPIYY